MFSLKTEFNQSAIHLAKNSHPKKHDWVHLEKILFSAETISEFTKSHVKTSEKHDNITQNSTNLGSFITTSRLKEMTSAETLAKPFSYSNTHICDD